MGDHYEGSYNSTGDSEVKYVVTEGHTEDWSGMRKSGVGVAGAVGNPAAIEEYHGEEEGYYQEGEWYYYEGQWYSHDGDSGPQVTEVVATTSDRGHRQVHAASAVDKNLSFRDESSSSTSSEDAEDAKVKAKSKSKSKKKGVEGQFDHLQEPDLDADSDPGNGGGYFENDYAINESVNRVSSWLRDASFGEHPYDSVSTPEHAQRMPRRPRPPRLDMAAHSDARRASAPFPGAYDDVGHNTDYEAQCYDKAPAYDQVNSADYGYNHEENQLAVIQGPLTANQAAFESVHRLEAKPVGKAKKFANNIAHGFADWSRNAALELSKASKKTADIVREKSIDFKHLAVPVLTPLVIAVIEESKDQLLGPDPGRGRGAPLAGRGRGRGPGRGAGPGPGRGPGARGPGARGAGGRGPGRGPGRGQPGPIGMAMRPLHQPPARPGMRPSMSNPGGPRPAMRPALRPGMPGNAVGSQPGMAPPRPNMIARPPPQYDGGFGPPAGAPATRDPRVPMRGQPRPLGPGRGRARPAAPPPPPPVN